MTVAAGDHGVVVIGAGQSGVASALALKDRGIRALVLDRADHVASAWRGRYDRLRLNTWRRNSRLPGRNFPKGTPKFPTRDQVAENIESHAREAGIELALSTTASRIDRDGDGWTVESTAGAFGTPQVIVATGHEHTPFIPPWSGRDGFVGPVIHSADYRNPEPFAGERVLVVGPGCSGMEIAYDLLDGGAAKVWLAVRTPPNIVLRTGPGGLPGDVLGVALMHVPIRVADAIVGLARKADIGDLSEYGLPVPEQGVFARQKELGVAPAIVDPEIIDAIKERRIEIVAGVESFERDAVVLADGSRLDAEAVICATGFRRGLEPLVGHLGVLDDAGNPARIHGEPAAPGLRFIGYDPRPGGLGHMAKEAKRAAKAIRAELAAEA